MTIQSIVSAENCNIGRYKVFIGLFLMRIFEETDKKETRKIVTAFDCEMKYLIQIFFFQRLEGGQRGRPWRTWRGRTEDTWTGASTPPCCSRMMKVNTTTNKQTNKQTNEKTIFFYPVERIFNQCKWLIYSADLLQHLHSTNSCKAFNHGDSAEILKTLML